MGRGSRRPRSTRPGTFDPNDTTRVKHTRIGVWDLYEQINPALAHVPGSSYAEKAFAAYECLPYLLRMIHDILSIRSCWWLLTAYTLAEVGQALLPAASLWYSGQLINILQTAIDTRTVDASLLFHICVGRVACSIARRLLNHALPSLRGPLARRLRARYSIHLFHARARLDLPTFEDPLVQRQLEEASSTSGSIAYDTLVMGTGIVSTLLQVVSQVGVLAQVLGGQRDGWLLAMLSFATSMGDWVTRWNVFATEQVWAATTKDKDYIQMVGMKFVVNNMEHRKEFIAGNLAEFMTREFKEVSERVGPDNAVDFHELRRESRSKRRFSLFGFLQDPLRELPQIVFTLRAVQYPASMPVSLASLNLLQQTTSHFSFTVWRFFDQTSSITEQLSTIRKLYEVANIPNRVEDGKVPFPEDAQKLRHGVSLEFKNVSFKYPGSDQYALQNVSFKLLPGQLCVIVGANGSGKSTILKLAVRLYDPFDGQIFLDGHDIRTLRLADLRAAVSVLFQDYTHFPLSIRDNIALGDPENFHNEAHVHMAARLGGASEFIAKLSEGYDTYLDKPVRDYFSGMPEGTRTLFGKQIDFSVVRGAGGMGSRASGPGLSGGQMQRLAVSRTFMRSVVSEDAKVGLLLFDEPSASLDPAAEHDLFGRLRELRGNKTMVFSSHRFGNLTRHADLILFMNESVIIEAGTHDQLIEQQGEYARIWMLQAQAFL
ncbi:P-loop containing nucleoside triphosphate hydrolase protein [Dichomitus squalens LYAD-421 SS1]|uniref:P-loop containing nucleoside triphosphate hydrolase protein n=1 Tax=Dichomitus squalens (strain LYAD-421) TaxID=732165 RepID=R7SJT9_DICSQ|nr:P-loop containing nucleoside triphosphate hydrolase protein [Dichomitus squalens LYAD-421 SS1]EJF56118.1 P-loop containing nucleoside triphosphate hydrolase protein [Dichomitus squalens LYAD-421 SS1]